MHRRLLTIRTRPAQGLPTRGTTQATTRSIITTRSTRTRGRTDFLKLEIRAIGIVRLRFGKGPPRRAFLVEKRHVIRSSHDRHTLRRPQIKISTLEGFSHVCKPGHRPADRYLIVSRAAPSPELRVC